MYPKNNALWYYDIFPKVVPVGKPVAITIRALSLQARFDTSVTVQVVPINSSPSSKGTVFHADSDGQEIRITHVFPEEQEYRFRLESASWKAAVWLDVYALEPDLLGTRPLIGDFHVHSCLSDGQEGPDFVAARYREEGFDFVTITDHRRYQPSLMAIRAFEDLSLSFQIYPGEEIHTPDNEVHLINFASSKSANAECLLAAEDNWRNTEPRPGWLERVSEYQKSLPPRPEGIDPFTHASCMLAAQIVREGGGMCILAHPHWQWNVRNVPDVYTRYCMENGLMDALEILGGQTCAENLTQVAFYNELRVQGLQIPIVGTSDSHGACNTQAGELPDTYRMFMEEKTMVFAVDNTREGIIKAVKGLFSVAIEQYGGEQYRIYGPYRLVQYALFLLRNYFPLQDELCREEGRLMRRFIAGDQEAGNRLRQIGRQTDLLRGQYFSA